MKTSGCLRTAAATRSFGTGLMPDVVTSVEFMRTAIIFRARYWSARSSRETGVFSRPKYAAICSARRPEALITPRPSGARGRRSRQGPSRSRDRARLAQPGDLALVLAELREHRGPVLAH